MSLVNVTCVDVRKNPATLFEPFELEVVFECLEDLQDDLEWKLIYVGSADNKALDQELDCVVMGPIHRGALKFTLEADAPDFSKIPPQDIHGFTILLLTGSYRDEEFIRIGWYVHNVYVDEEMQEDPPDVPQLQNLRRHILTEAPRVTRFKISWDVKSEPHGQMHSESELSGAVTQPTHSSVSGMGSSKAAEAVAGSNGHSSPCFGYGTVPSDRPPQNSTSGKLEGTEVVNRMPSSSDRQQAQEYLVPTANSNGNNDPSLLNSTPAAVRGYHMVEQEQQRPLQNQPHLVMQMGQHYHYGHNQPQKLVAQNPQQQFITAVHTNPFSFCTHPATDGQWTTSQMSTAPALCLPPGGQMLSGQYQRMPPMTQALRSAGMALVPPAPPHHLLLPQTYGPSTSVDGITPPHIAGPHSQPYYPPDGLGAATYAEGHFVDVEMR